MGVKGTPLLDESNTDGLRCGIVKKVFLIFVVALPKIIGGMSSSYSSIALPQMSLNVSELSWFSSLPLFTAPLGAILVGVIIDKYGRRTALLFGIVPDVLGWFMLYVNCNNAVIFFGRALTGISVGSSYYPPNLYMAECLLVNEPHSRDRILLWTTVFFTSGEFFIYPLGYICKYYKISGVISVISVISFLLIYVVIPESPSWLYLRGRTGDAEWSQKKLGICQRFPKREPGFSSSYTITWSSFKTGLAKLRRQDVNRPLAITSALIILHKFSGITLFTNYLTAIISGNSSFDSSASTSATSSESYVYSMIAQLLVIVANFVSGFVLPWTGIKKLTTIAVSGATVGMVLVALTSAADTAADWFLVRAFAVCLVMFMFQLGMANVVRVVVCETFPIDARGFASVPVVLMNIAAAVLSKVHPYLVTSLGGNTYFIYAGCIVMYGLVFNLFVPETVGKTLEEINEKMA